MRERCLEAFYGAKSSSYLELYDGFATWFWRACARDRYIRHFNELQEACFHRACEMDGVRRIDYDRVSSWHRPYIFKRG